MEVHLSSQRYIYQLLVPLKKLLITLIIRSAIEGPLSVNLEK